MQREKSLASVCLSLSLSVSYFVHQYQLSEYARVVPSRVKVYYVVLVVAATARPGRRAGRLISICTYVITLVEMIGTDGRMMTADSSSPLSGESSPTHYNIFLKYLLKTQISAFMQ